MTEQAEEQDLRKEPSQIEKVMAALEGHLGPARTPLYTNLGHLQRRVVCYLAFVSDFVYCDGKYSGYWKFNGFNISKALAVKGLLSLLTTRYGPEDTLSKRLAEQTPRGRPFINCSVIFNTVLQIIAGEIIADHIDQHFHTVGISSQQVSALVDSVFGSHNASSLDEIPF